MLFGHVQKAVSNVSVLVALMEEVGRTDDVESKSPSASTCFTSRHVGVFAGAVS